MLNERVTVEDLRQFWKGCVAMYKNEPVFVIGVADQGNGFVASVKELKTGEIVKVALDKEFLSPPDGRLGFANLNGNVFYVQRAPVRKFMMGVNDSNIKVIALKDYIRYEPGEASRLSTTSMEFYRTLKGEYPSFEKALDQVKTFGGSCAFDRQFAVDEERRIYYKRYKVGKAGRGAIDKRGIVFDERYTFLKSVIGGFDYEEAARNSR